MDMSTQKYLSPTSWTFDFDLSTAPDQSCFFKTRPDYWINPEPNGERILLEIWEGMKRQREPGITTSGRCQYYCSATRRRCAVGILFSSGEYRMDMEGKRVEVLAEEGLLPSRLRHYVSLLRQVQHSHDSIADMCFNMHRMDRFLPHFGTALAELAGNFGYVALASRIKAEANKLQSGPPPYFVRREYYDMSDLTSPVKVEMVA